MHGTVGQGRRLGAALGVAWCLLGGAPVLAAAAAAGTSPAPGPAFQDLPREALHEVERGQDLHLIAGYYYGDARQWERIWQANREVLKNPNRLSVGMVLRIPLDRDWRQDLSYADWIKGGGGARAGVSGAAPAAPPAPPAVPPAGRRGEAPAGEPLPPPPGPVSLRYRPAKGSAQTIRFTIQGKIVTEAQGRTQPEDMNMGARLRIAVEDVAADGGVRQALTLSDPRGAKTSFAGVGLPEPGETIRETVSPLNKVVQVEGKEPGTPYYSSPILFPEGPVAVGGSWQFEDRHQFAAGITLIDTSRCTLVRRERFRGEEAYRIQCQSTGAPAPEDRARITYSASGPATFLIRAADGTLMSVVNSVRASTEVPAQKVRVSSELQGVFDEEAPAAGRAAR